MKFTVVYFGIGGRAEPIRLAAAVGKIPFTNKAVTFAEFGAMRTELPLGQVPVLEIEEEGKDKVVVTQSDAILRYFGRRAGLYPEDPMEAMKVDAMIDVMKDFTKHIELTVQGAVGSLISDKEFSDEEKLAIRKRIVETAIPKYLGFVEKTLKDNGSGWLVGDSMTIADLKLHQGVTWITSGILDGIPPSCLDAYPLILANIEMVNKVPEVAAWHEKYPKPYSTFDFVPN